MTREEEISLASKLQKNSFLVNCIVARKAAEVMMAYANGEEIDTIHHSDK